MSAPLFPLRIALLLLLAWSARGSAMAATFYVRTDGGNASQCTGRANTAYSGSGSGQACAWKHPYYALPANGALRIAGGDTLIIGAGEYMIGFGAPGASDVAGRCYSAGPYDCYLPPIPSGPSASLKTRILGQGHDTGCAAPPKLWGTQRVSLMLNLQNSSNVEIGCLEVTDKSDCVEFHSNGAARCVRDAAPYGDWAGVGLSARASSNVWLHDVNIHGLANRGISAGGLNNWTLERVKINGNGWAGWDGDIGAGSSNTGAIVMRQVEIAWNGCGQRWQTGVAWACWGQQAGGYGDGIGTATTGGQWLIEDSFVHHNTSDGIDLLYMDGAATSSVTVRRVYAAGNAGNQVKTAGAATIENSILIGNCSYFLGKDFMTQDDNCRALGNTLSVGVAAGQTTTIRHNTIIGEGDCLILSGGGNSASRLNIQNNALVGQLDWRSNLQGNIGELTCGQYQDGGTPVTTFTANSFWNVKQNQCPSGSPANICGQNPLLKNMTLANFDAEPLAGSPLIDRAPVLAGITTDFYLRPRPFGPAPDIGAIEKGATSVIDSVLPVVGNVGASTDSAIVTLSATATDNIGVTSVSFVVDGVVVGTTSFAPYVATVNTNAIGYGSHTLVVRAYDAAGNLASSSAFAFETEKSTYRVIPPTKPMRIGGGKLRETAEPFYARFIAPVLALVSDAAPAVETRNGKLLRRTER